MGYANFASFAYLINILQLQVHARKAASSSKSIVPDLIILSDF